MLAAYGRSMMTERERATDDSGRDQVSRSRGPRAIARQDAVSSQSEERHADDAEVVSRSQKPRGIASYPPDRS